MPGPERTLVLFMLRTRRPSYRFVVVGNIVSREPAFTRQLPDTSAHSTRHQ